MGGLKIIELRAENFKRLKAVSIRPTANTVIVSGANEQGKTSVLDSIFWALGGAAMTKATGTKAPIRNGQKKAVVKIDVGEFVVTRKATASGETLTVEGKDGGQYRTPQAVLDGVIGKIAIDPLSFATMAEKEQRETLLKVVDIGIDLQEMAERRKGLFEMRTATGREVKRYEGALLALTPPPAGVADAETPAADVVAKIEVAQAINSANAEKRRLAERIREDVAKIEAEIAAAKSRLESAKDALVMAEGEADGLQDVDVEPLKAELSGLEANNARVRNARQWRSTKAGLEEAETMYTGYTRAIEEIDTKKAEAILNAAFPVPGLGFDDVGVTFKDVPFAQCSSAERLRVSVALAMAANPRLRVIRITDGSLLDKTNLQIIEEMAVDNDYQIWVEKVDESGRVGFYVEDGEIREGGAK